MRHADPSVTREHYAHIVGDAERLASEKFSQRIGQNITQLESDSELESTSQLRPRKQRAWRKRVGVEPTTRLAKSRIAGFEGRGDHRTPFAPVLLYPTNNTTVYVTSGARLRAALFLSVSIVVSVRFRDNCATA